VLLGLSSEFVSPGCIQCATPRGVFPTRRNSTVRGLLGSFGFRVLKGQRFLVRPSRAGEIDGVFAAYVAGSRSV